MHALIHRVTSLLTPFNCQLNYIAQSQREYQSQLPLLPLELWLEIFQFATYVHRSTTLKPIDPFTRKRTSRNVMALNTPVMAMRTKLSVVLVSRLWQITAVRILYEHLVIRSPARANLILRVLEESRDIHSHRDDVSQSDRYPSSNMGYGQWVKHIEIHAYAHGASKIQFLKTLFPIYGSNLQELYWNERGPDRRLERDTFTSAQLLGSFKALRVLDLRHFLGSDNIKNESDASLSTRPTLPFVQDLIISAHSRSLVIAISLCFPALQNLTLRTSPTDVISTELLYLFLRTHGHFLVSVDLPTPSPEFEPEYDTAQPPRTSPHVNPDVFLQTGVCPNLVSISFPVTSPQLAPHVHASVRRIGLRGVRGDRLYPDKLSSCKDHLMAITPTRYPNLELVQTVGFLVEADSDDLVKDVFIWWVERFEKYGIDFLDGEGVLWAYAD
ncbi:hypothetical protein BDQ17DRAFT_1346531 [Cyathus striatus]|nr:hypothetical protein BDQ17DRAFT_1346531 [Cyathus striatus]